MKKYRFWLSVLMCVTVLFSTVAGTSVCSLAGAVEAGAKSETSSKAAASPSSATPPVETATPGSSAQAVYWLDSYDFWYAYRPLSLELGVPLGDNEIPDTVDLWLEGPDGFLEDSVTLPVKWDFSGVDFEREGSYMVTGILDTASCEYPVDWDSTPPPSFTLEIKRGGVLTFETETDGDTLTLFYKMNEEDFLFPATELSFQLYESPDNGENWRNITRSKRVDADNDSVSISKITGASLFQITDLRLGGFYSDLSDIVKATGNDGNIETVEIIPSGGIKGAGNWNPEPVMDGPYQILNYKCSFRPYPELLVHVEKGHPEKLEMLWEHYSSVRVCYGDKPDGLWNENGLVLPVEWDRGGAAAIDWWTVGDTGIHGHFPEEIMGEYSGLLNFESMPELTLTVSLYSAANPFGLLSRQETLFENNRVELEFFSDPDGHSVPVNFDDISGLTAWCSVDGGENWYDVTEVSPISLSGDSLSAAFLKESFLNGKGYSFQLEQACDPGLERYSSAVTVFLNSDKSISFHSSAGGERGGGKRQGKPPEGLFGQGGSEETPTETSSETPAETPSETPAETPSETSPEAPTEASSETSPETSSEAPAETSSETPAETSPEAPTETSPTLENPAPPAGGNSSGVPGSKAAKNSNTGPGIHLPESLSDVQTSPEQALPTNQTAGKVPLESQTPAAGRTLAADQISPAGQAPEADQIPTSADPAALEALSPPSSAPGNAKAEEESAESMTKPMAASASFPHMSPRMIFCGAAILSGILAGVWMIRRR